MTLLSANSLSSGSTTFSLRPFEATPETADLEISTIITRDRNILSLSYRLQGDLSKVAISPSSDASSEKNRRKDRLWEQTCFEFFIKEGAGASEAYWEFNLSPAGDWNVFSLQGYRQGLKEEQAFSQLPFSTQISAAALRLDIAVDIGALVAEFQPLMMGVSAVVVLLPAQESFWAIAHPAPQADFHHPDSFVIDLSPLNSVT